MARRIVNRGSVIRAPRRDVAWGAVTLLDWTTLAASSSVIAASFSSSALGTAGLSPGTLVRVRGELNVETDQEAASEAFSGAFGIAMVQQPALAGGVGNIPTPITEAASDVWQTWQPFSSAFTFVSATGLHSSDGRYVIDSKAMRKIEPGEALVLVLENAAAVGMNFVLNVRLLFKYH